MEVQEVDSGRLMAAVPVADVQLLTLRQGSPAQRPMVQIVVGTMFAAFGLGVVIHLISWMGRGGVLFGTEVWLVMPAAVGLWMLYEALQRRYYLEATLSGGSKKLAFDGKPTAAEADEFLTQLQARCKLNVARGVAGAGFPLPPRQ